MIICHLVVCGQTCKVSPRILKGQGDGIMLKFVESRVVLKKDVMT